MVVEKKEAVSVVASEQRHHYLEGSKLVFVLVAVTLAFFLVMLDTSIVATAIPQITTELHSLLDIGWYGSAYQLSTASFQPLSGKLYTHFSTKWVFLSFFAIFQTGSLVCGVARSSPMLIVGRALAGLGSSGLMNGALVIWASCVPPSRLPVLQSLLIAVGQIGVAGGPVLGGALTEKVGWRWCFYINLPVGGVTAILLTLVTIPERTQKSPARTLLSAETYYRTLDLIGFAIFAPAASMFFLALEFGGNQYAWRSSTVIGLFSGAFATFSVFLLWEWRQGNAAMVPFALLRRGLVWSSSGMMFCFLGTMFTVAYYFPIWLQVVKGNSPLTSGVHNLPLFGSQVITVMITGLTVQKMGYCLPPALLGTVLVAVGAGLLSTLQPSASAARWVGYQIIYGIGVGAVVQMPFISFQMFLPPPQIPSAMAILILSQYFGAALWVTVAQSIFSNSMREMIPKFAPGVEVEWAIKAGARALREKLKGEQLEGVQMVCSKSFGRDMYLAAGLSVVAFMGAWGLRWESVKRPKRDSETGIGITEKEMKEKQDEN